MDTRTTLKRAADPDEDADCRLTKRPTTTPEILDDFPSYTLEDLASFEDAVLDLPDFRLEEWDHLDISQPPEPTYDLDSLSAWDNTLTIPSDTSNSLFSTPNYVATLADPNEKVCLGMLFETRCQQLLTAHSLRSEQFSTESPLSDGYIELSIRHNQNRSVLCLSQTQDLANLNARAALALAEIQSMHAATIVVYGKQKDLRDIFTAGPPPKKHPKIVNVHVNVYGARANAEAIGARLSNRGLFLQNPISSNHAEEYRNPQFWAFDSLSEIDILLEEIKLSTGSHTELETDWSLALNDLPQHQMLSPQTDNSRLRVPLLPHQLDAQDFMISRELGTGGNHLKYWQPSFSGDGACVFRHAVTMMERYECPLEPRSGILADDMGLGKTLTSLSLVTSSLDRAAIYGNSRARYESRITTLTNTKTTLVVAPSLLILDGWVNEIQKQLHSSCLKYTKYHGHERVQCFSDLRDYDVVFTTYGTITTEFRRMRSRKVLYHLRWFRIILDEAHTIRSQSTKQFDAVINLQAEHYWCLTGTPISNKIEDISALLRFCRVPLLEDRKFFRENVLKGAKKSFKVGCQAVQKVLGPLCLRRTKAILQLPEPTAMLQPIHLSPAETEQYQAVMKSCKRALEATVSGRLHSSAKHTLLQSILRLRIFCNHGTFMPIPVDETENDPDEALALLQEKEKDHCSHCLVRVSLIDQIQDPSSGVMMTCEHTLCNTCWKEASSQPGSDSVVCLVCDQQVSRKDYRASDSAADGARPSQPQISSKLNCLLQSLQESQGREKSLVFSCWKKTIDLASRLCTEQGIRHVCIDGQTPQHERTRALQGFINNENISTLLMTMGTGALGLNLTAATRIHILEPQWNPWVEEQAIGRAVRIGQERETTVIRYVVQNTVEEHIKTYQWRKIMLAAGGFGDSSAASVDAQVRLLTATAFRDGAV